MKNEIIIPLKNGGSLRCGKGTVYQYGGYLRICDSKGNEILYWDVSEWETTGEGESVIGAAFAASLKSIKELTKDRKLVNRIWVYRRPKTS